MPLQLLPETAFADPNHLKRHRETTNRILNHSFDDSRVKTPAESLAGVTIVNPAFEPGDIRRYGAIRGQDSTNAIADAVLVAEQNLGIDVYIPAGDWILTSTITINAGKQVNIHGEGKSLSIIVISGFSSAVYAFDYDGNTGARHDSIYVEDIWFFSTNGLGRAIKATWVINSSFRNLYFYDLQDGWVGDNAHGNEFTNINTFSISGTSVILGEACNNCIFLKSRFSGNSGISSDNDCLGLTILGCDFEGIVGNGAGIILFPTAGKQVNGVVISGNYFENIDGTAIYLSGTDANSIRGVTVTGNYITGGFVDHPTKTFCKNAVLLHNVNGFSFDANRIDDWELQAFNLDGTETNGRVTNNYTTRVTALSDQDFTTSVEVFNNGSFGPQKIHRPLAEFANLAYSATIATDAGVARTYMVTPTNGTAYTMSNPTNGYAGARRTWTHKNTFGAAIGAVTWASNFKLQAAWTQPATGFNRSITFYSPDGTLWYEESRVTADVAN